MGKELWIIHGNGARPSREGRTPRRSRAIDISTPDPHENPSLRSLLVPLVKQQQALIDTGLFTKFQGFGEGAEEGKRLLDVFIESPFFQPVFDIAVTESEIVRARFSEQDYLRYLAGKTFETLAIVYRIAQKAEDGKVVLTPENVHTLYRKHVHPGEEPVPFPFGYVVAGHHGQPDGLVVDPGRDMKIEEVIECTVAGHPNKYQRQEKSFKDTQKTGKIFSQDTQLTFLVPSQQRSDRYEGDFTIIQLPFTHEQFRVTMRQVYEDMKKDGLTLQERYANAHRPSGILIPGEEVVLRRNQL